jgi:hypothetical protein
LAGDRSVRRFEQSVVVFFHVDSTVISDFGERDRLTRRTLRVGFWQTASPLGEFKSVGWEP